MKLTLDNLGTSPLDHALSYGRDGFKIVFVHAPVFGKSRAPTAENPTATGCTCRRKSSCGDTGKHPVLDSWPRIASIEENEIRDQYRKIKIDDPNVGIVLGEQPSGSYLVAIDVDDEARFAELEKELGPLPESPRGESSFGKYRLLYELSSDVARDRLRNVTGIGEKAGVDAKVRNGQVVVAPSRHPSGQVYTWTRGGDLAVLPAAWAVELLAPEIKIPDWAKNYTPQTIKEDSRAKKRAEKYLEAAVIKDAGLIASSGKGLRHNTVRDRAFALFALCGGLCLGGNHWDYVRREIEVAALASGLPIKEVRGLISSAEVKVTKGGIVRVPVGLQTPTNGTSHSASPAQAPATTPAPPVAAAVGAPAPIVAVSDPLACIQLEMDKGAPAKIAENVARLLSQHPIWSGGPAFDVYSQTPLWPLPLPAPIACIHRYHREIVDADFDAIQGWIMALPDTHRVRGGIDTMHGGVRLAASRRRVDLLTQYVNYLSPWDRTSRIGSWTVDHLGCDDTPYNRATGRAWIVACVERALIPGTTVDMIPVLEGDQGVGKNRALETLFEGGPRHAPWLTIISGHKLDQDETKRLACTRWVLHDDELQGMGDCRRIDALKSWVSRPRETYRLQYDRTITTSPRRALLVGSINRRTYLHDDTGNRRWYPWAVGTIRVDTLAAAREQLFAEALFAIRHSGEHWRDSLTQSVRLMAAEEAERRKIDDPIVDQIGLMMHGKYKGSLGLPEELTTHSIGERLGYSVEKIDKNLEMRIASAMRELRFRSKRVGGRRYYEIDTTH